MCSYCKKHRVLKDLDISLLPPDFIKTNSFVDDYGRGEMVSNLFKSWRRKGDMVRLNGEPVVYKMIKLGTFWVIF